MSFLDKLPRIILIVLLGITILVAALFYGGSSEEVSINSTAYTEPVFSNLLLVWTYILSGLAIFVTLAFVILKFARKAIDNPKSAIAPLGILVGAVLLCVITYSLGDGTPLKLPGYDGQDNVYSWLKISDMLLYICYILGITSVLLIIYSGVSKLFKK